GIRCRHVVDQAGLLDPERLVPSIAERGDDQICVQAALAVAAARGALAKAGREAADIDAVIVAATGLQRAYPAVAVEVQQALGARGYAYDMNVACSSATFALRSAVDAVACGSARRALV
ncbi:beta-ketoacyl-ACP synthase III, partial [Acinetobacter baumannii]